MSSDRYEDARRLRKAVAVLEQHIARAFVEARGAVLAGVQPKPAPAPGAPAPAPETTPSMGWQGPPPPNAPRLEAENLSPEEARDLLRGYVQDLRAVAHSFDNCAKLVSLLADLLEGAPVSMRQASTTPSAQTGTVTTERRERRSPTKGWSL